MNLSKLAAGGIWTQKLPTLQDVAGIFASKSTYFNHNQVFAEVHKFPLVEKWLLHAEDAPSDSVLWGFKKPTYAKLQKLVEFKEEKKGKDKKKKGKKHRDSSPSEPSPERMSDKKGKGKKCQDTPSSESSAEMMAGKKGKGKKGGDSGKKGSSSKSHSL